MKVKKILCASLTMVPATICLSATNIPNNTKPNILVFIADDAGMDFGCYGNKVIQTPHIDRLASLGLRFEKAFITSPQSSPSRTSIMTGQFAHTIGTEDLHSGIDDQTLMLPYYFRQAGYSTGYMLKTHWGANGDKQFDVKIEGDYKPNQGDLSEEAFIHFEQFIQEQSDNPFFLWVGFKDAHRPYDREKCPQVNHPESIQVPSYLIDSPDTRRDLADYYDEITRMDSHIGHMLAILEKYGKSDNTVIVFLSDNGMPFPRCKGTLYDTGIQTPLIFVWPGKIQPGEIHKNGLITTVDLGPTLLEIAGINPNKDIYGKSFKQLLFNPALRGREYIYAERNWHNTDDYIRCIRNEKMKLIYNAYYELPHGIALDLSTSPSWYELRKAKKQGILTDAQMLHFTVPRPMIEIYDLELDPCELVNVADDPAYLEEGKKLMKLLNEWQLETSDHPYWERRRSDNSDRITGFPLLRERSGYIDEKYND